jgi:hypothetical protein
MICVPIALPNGFFNVKIESMFACKCTCHAHALTIGLVGM